MKNAHCSTSLLLPGSPDTLHVLHYENVKSDLRGEIKNLLLFLGIIPDDKRINCLLKQASGSFQRASLNGLDKKLPFRKQMRMKIDQVIAEVNKLLVRRGYQMMPLGKIHFHAPNNILNKQ